MIKKVFLIGFILSFLGLNAQIIDNFDDNDLNNNPKWTGNLVSFSNINGLLKSNNSTVNSNYAIHTPLSITDSFEWKLDVDLRFNTSSKNIVFFTLLANKIINPDSAFIVKIGGTKDKLSLIKVLNGKQTELISGLDKRLNSSSNKFTISVKYNNGKWEMFFNNTKEGEFTDKTDLNKGNLSISIFQSTVSFFGKHYFDNLVARPQIPDKTKPLVKSVLVLDNSHIELTFSEDIDTFSVIKNNISFKKNTLKSMYFVQEDKLHISINTPLTNNEKEEITLQNFKDKAGNTNSLQAFDFQYFKVESPKYLSVYISEIMADPEPVIGNLPNAEYIEIHNPNDISYNLNSCFILKGSTRYFFPNSTIKPHQYLIACKVSDTTFFKPFGTVLAMNKFPSLANNGELLEIKNKKGHLIHGVEYSSQWHLQNLKKQGGFSLELKDSLKPCMEANNWESSKSKNGGTPGSPNSIAAVITPHDITKLTQVYPVNNNVLRLSFSSTVDSVAFINLNKFKLSHGINVQKLLSFKNNNKDVYIQLDNNLKTNIIYSISTHNLADCLGREISSSKHEFALPNTINKGDIIINEILSNSSTNTFDFVELFNVSDKALDLKEVFFSKTNSNGTTVNIAPKGALVLPKKYIVFGYKPELLTRFYQSNNSSYVATDFDLSLNASKGNAIILNKLGNLLDSVSYSEKMHHPNIAAQKGVSLERISPARPSLNFDNWTSASIDKNYATPGYKNSQYIENISANGTMQLSSKSFSPDNSGQNNILEILYNFPDNGFVATLQIYNLKGALVKTVYQGKVLSKTGSYYWNGRNNDNIALPVGIYVVYLNATKDAEKIHVKKAVSITSSF